MSAKTLAAAESTGDPGRDQVTAASKQLLQELSGNRIIMGQLFAISIEFQTYLLI